MADSRFANNPFIEDEDLQEPGVRDTRLGGQGLGTRSAGPTRTGSQISSGTGFGVTGSADLDPFVREAQAPGRDIIADRQDLITQEQATELGRNAQFQAQTPQSSQGGFRSDGSRIESNGQGTFSSVSRGQASQGSVGDNSGTGSNSGSDFLRPGERTLVNQANQRQTRNQALGDLASSNQAIRDQIDGFAARRDRRNARVGAGFGLGRVAAREARANVEAQQAQEVAQLRREGLARIGQNVQAFDTAQAAAAQGAVQDEGETLRRRIGTASAERIAGADRRSDETVAQAQARQEQIKFLAEQSGEAADRRIQQQRNISEAEGRLGTIQAKVQGDILDAIASGTATPAQIQEILAQFS